jgi:hypothetical protein
LIKKTGESKKAKKKGREGSTWYHALSRWMNDCEKNEKLVDDQN